MAQASPLECPSCGAVLRSENFDETRGIGKCVDCGVLVRIPRLARAIAQSKPREPLPLPPGLSVLDLPGGTEIQRRWFTPWILPLVAFCVFWDGFLLVFYAVAFATGASLPLLAIPLIHLTVGVGLTYFVLAVMFNRTFIRVEDGRLSVAHRPVRWFGARELERADIAQLYCKERVRRGRNGTCSSFELWILRHDGGSERLVSSQCDEDQVLFLEQRLEQALGIADRPVGGEMAR